VALGTLAVGTLTAIELRHRRALASDDEWSRLCSPLSGRGAQVTSRDGTLIHVETLGDGNRPTFVLAPGWTEEILLWGPVARALVERGFRVVLYDLRGQGASGLAPGGDYTLARYGEDLDAVLAAAAADGAGQELIVGGHSLGGMSIVAWAVAHQPRSRVRAAAMINTAVSGVISESGTLVRGMPAAVKHWFGVHVVLDNPVPRLPVSTVMNRALVRSLGFGPHATDAQVALVERMQWSCPAPVRNAAGRSIAAMDLSWAVSALTVPTMVIGSELDVLLPPAHSERIAAALPELVDLVVLPEVGHISPLEASDRLVDELVRLASVVRPEAPGTASREPGESPGECH
jgi:pimeloyl-ACP methyl ester carboxylesterase